MVRANAEGEALTGAPVAVTGTHEHVAVFPRFAPAAALRYDVERRTAMPTTPAARIFHDADADPAAIVGKTVAVIGYGNQGRSQALNVRDSGLATIVGNRDDDYAAQARADGFAVLPIGDACARADVIALLVPDEVMPAVYAESVRPHLRASTVLDFASGY